MRLRAVRHTYITTQRTPADTFGGLFRVCASKHGLIEVAAFQRDLLDQLAVRVYHTRQVGDVVRLERNEEVEELCAAAIGQRFITERNADELGFVCVLEGLEAGKCAVELCSVFLLAIQVREDAKRLWVLCIRGQNTLQKRLGCSRPPPLISASAAYFG